MIDALAFVILFVLLFSGSGRDDTDGPDGISHMMLFTDHATGVQYLASNPFGGLTPRLNADGTLHTIKKEIKE